MGLCTGDDNGDLVTKVEPPKHTNPIEDEVVLTPEIKEHEILSKEMIENKRPWFDDLTMDMYRASTTEIDGSKVYVEYFSMMTARDSISSGTSNLISAAHREYIRINNYPIYLNGDLNTNTDAVEQKTDTESETTIVGVLPPQTGDYFVLSTGFNRNSVLKILKVKPLSIYDDRAYSVTYAMEEASTGALYEDLTSKVVRTLNYVRENHQLGVKYLLTDEEVQNAIEDKLLESNLFDCYVAEYYDRDLKVFGVKTHNGFHTDMIIQNFLSKIERCPSDMYFYTEYDETAKLDTIFDVMLYMSPSKLLNMMDKVYYYRLESPTDIGHIQPVLVSPITSMPFQKSSRMMKVRAPNVAHSVIHEGGSVSLAEISLDEVFDEAYITNTKYFPNVLQNENYLLSEDFYAGGYGNTLEELLREALARKPIARSRVVDLVGKLATIEHEERFFITPFVLVLIKIMQMSR